MICLKNRETEEFLETYKSLIQINNYFNGSQKELSFGVKDIPKIISNAKGFQQYCPSKILPEIQKAEKFYKSLEEKFK